MLDHPHIIKLYQVKLEHLFWQFIAIFKIDLTCLLVVSNVGKPSRWIGADVSFSRSPACVIESAGLNLQQTTRHSISVSALFSLTMKLWSERITAILLGLVRDRQYCMCNPHRVGKTKVTSITYVFQVLCHVRILSISEGCRRFYRFAQKQIHLKNLPRVFRQGLHKLPWNLQLFSVSQIPDVFQHIIHSAMTQLKYFCL